MDNQNNFFENKIAVVTGGGIALAAASGAGDIIPVLIK